jgi:hypothetical protein
MLNALKENRLHILIWALMLAYVIAAPDLYARFVLKNGKPVQESVELPVPTDQILFSADRLDPVPGGQGLFNLWGWAFAREEPDQSHYERFIVLQSSTNTYFFPTQSFEYPQVQAAFPDLAINVMNSGFSTYISKDLIQPGSYQVGILFRHRTSSAIYYRISNKLIARTGDQLFLELANSQP